MNTANVHLIFLINHTKLQRTSFIKQKYVTEIYKLKIPSQTGTGKNNFAKPLANGFRKTSNACDN